MRRLSACMIVKDEEKVIARCLESILPHVDECIVIDTGSTDDTILILNDLYHRNQHLTIYRDKWNGSFADMRNKSMDYATGDILFIIDADEYAMNQDWVSVRRMIDDPNFLVGMPSILNTTSQGPVLGERVLQPRFFLNHPDIRYKYAIHNQIDDAYLGYARKMYAEGKEDLMIVEMRGFEIIHTGYDLTPDEVQDKYVHRAEICKQQVETAINEGSARDEAYYRYQLAVFYSMLDVEKSVDEWEAIKYEHLNVFNRWYAHYLAARVYLNAAVPALDTDLYEKTLSHCAGMFEAIDAPQTGYHALAPEPITWMITGIAMADLGYLKGDTSIVNEGIIMMIDALLRQMAAPKQARCIINARVLYDDIKNKFDPSTLEYQMLDTTDLRKGIDALREIQKSLHAFDDSLLNLVDREYL